MKKLILATDVRFWEQGSGSQVRLAALYRYFSYLGIETHIFFVQRLTQKDQACLAADFPDMLVHCRPELMEEARAEAAQAAEQKPSLVVRVLRRLGLVSPVSSQGESNAEKRPGDFVSPPHQRYLGELCRGIQPDFVLVTYIRLASLIDGLPTKKRPTTLIDTIDVMHLRAERYHAAGERHWINISREEEAALLRPFDHVLAIQPRDAKILRGMAPSKRVITAMHPTEPMWHEPHDKKPVRLFYLATKGLPHQKAIAHFLEHVWPSVSERFGDAVRLCLGGSVCELYADASPMATELLGFLDDLYAAYDAADIVINPVLFGGGLKIKCVEALAHAKPLVTTPVGAEGLEDGVGEAFLVAEDDYAFVTHLAQLVESTEERHRLAEGAYAYAKAHFTEEAAFAELRAVLLPEPKAGVGTEGGPGL